jgi:FkbM family methyltransferase
MINEIAAGFHNCDENRLLTTGKKGLADHSQFGELAILLRLLLQTNESKRIIVDVGARGRERSNSYDLLSQFGWKGFLVEANPRLHDSIRTDFAGTDYDLIGVAVGVEEGSRPFYIGINDDVSSLLRDHAVDWGDIRDVVDVQVRRLPAILDDLGIPVRFDLLSLDIEGMDVVVLNDLIENSRYRPDHIIIEASYSFSTKTLADVHAAQGVQDLYEIAGQTEANLILRLRDLVACKVG